MKLQSGGLCASRYLFEAMNAVLVNSLILPLSCAFQFCEGMSRTSHQLTVLNDLIHTSLTVIHLGWNAGLLYDATELHLSNH